MQGGDRALLATERTGTAVAEHASDVRRRAHDSDLDVEIAGLDALDLGSGRTRSRSAKMWAATWPKLAAIAIALALWELVVLSGWKDPWVLPGPGPVFSRLWDDLLDGEILQATWLTLRRALWGFALATVVGGAVGVLISRWQVLRVAFGSFITGLQTMPSIAWFPLALLLFQRSEGAITFVVVLGAAPAIANGVINGADNVPPLLLRSGTVLGARGLGLYRTVTMPASLPSILAGFKQGWAFAWRSLMAGELLVIIPGVRSIGFRLQVDREMSDAVGLLGTMITILAIGILVDSLVFGTAERAVRRRWGLVDPAA
jgi:NitT/TauT family transport system permease protein